MKLLVVDDHVLILDALRGVLKELDSGAIILEASRWSDAARLLTEHGDLSLILLDLSLPDYDGFTALKDLQEQHTGIPVVVLSATRDRDSIVKALELGAVGFIPKSGRVEVMLVALRLVFSGGVYIPSEILSRSEAAAMLAHRHLIISTPHLCSPTLDRCATFGASWIRSAGITCCPRSLLFATPKQRKSESASPCWAWNGCCLQAILRRSPRRAADSDQPARSSIIPAAAPCWPRHRGGLWLV